MHKMTAFSFIFPHSQRSKCCSNMRNAECLRSMKALCLPHWVDYKMNGCYCQSVYVFIVVSLGIYVISFQGLITIIIAISITTSLLIHSAPHDLIQWHVSLFIHSKCETHFPSLKTYFIPLWKEIHELNK